MKIIKFACTSTIATLVDLALYSILLYILAPTIANVLSYTTGMLINYYLQRKLIFDENRSTRISFLLSLFFSIGGLLLSTLLIYLLINFSAFKNTPLIAKIIVIFIIFFYNYNTKKFAFGDKR